MDKLTESIVGEIKKFEKGKFDVNEIINVASDLKYSKEIKGILKQEFNDPSEEFTKLIAKQVYSGRVTSSILEQFQGLIKKSLKEYISETISSRLQMAEHWSNDKETEEEVKVEQEEVLDDSGIVTTEEELQGFRMVQAILVPIVESIRITHRDTKSYFGILLDDNNRKPICRLHLNRTKKYLEVFDEHKKGIKHNITTMDDLYKHKEAIINSLNHYINDELPVE
ncbi:MAG: hypothetical protein ACRBFS_03250 [Aureispira sp.]